MIENVSTQLTMFHCLCPLPASRKGLRLPLRSALFGEGGRDWRPCTKCFQKLMDKVIYLVDLIFRFHTLIKVGCENISKKVSEYDQEIPQSLTADNPVAPRGRVAQPSRDTRKTNKQSNQLSLTHQDDCNTRTDTKQRTTKQNNYRLPQWELQ